MYSRRRLVHAIINSNSVNNIQRRRVERVKKLVKDRALLISHKLKATRRLVVCSVATLVYNVLVKFDVSQMLNL